MNSHKHYSSIKAIHQRGFTTLTFVIITSAILSFLIFSHSHPDSDFLLQIIHIEHVYDEYYQQQSNDVIRILLMEN